MLYVYIGCLTFGVFYSILSAILGGHHGFDHSGFDHSGFDHAGLEHGGIDHDGIHADSSADNTYTPSPFNPLVIASAVTTFGAIGVITKMGFHMGDLLSVIFATSFAGVIGALIFFLVVKLIYSSQSDSSFSLNDLVGNEAKILTPIPENGLGEVTLVEGGIRYNFTAKSFNNEYIGRGETVKIREVLGNTVVVSRVVTIEDLEESENENRKTKEDN